MKYFKSVFYFKSGPSSFLKVLFLSAFLLVLVGCACSGIYYKEFADKDEEEFSKTIDTIVLFTYYSIDFKKNKCRRHTAVLPRAIKILEEKGYKVRKVVPNFHRYSFKREKNGAGKLIYLDHKETYNKTEAFLEIWTSSQSVPGKKRYYVSEGKAALVNHGSSKPIFEKQSTYSNQINGDSSLVGMIDALLCDIPDRSEIRKDSFEGGTYTNEEMFFSCEFPYGWIIKKESISESYGRISARCHTETLPGNLSDIALERVVNYSMEAFESQLKGIAKKLGLGQISEKKTLGDSEMAVYLFQSESKNLIVKTALFPGKQKDYYKITFRSKPEEPFSSEFDTLIETFKVHSPIKTYSKWLKHSDPKQRLKAIRALRNLKAKGVGAIPLCINALLDSDKEVREEAARALGKIGRPAEEAVPALIQALGDRESSVGRRASRALLDIYRSGVISVIPKLIENLTHSNYSVRLHSLESLIRLGSKGRKAAPQMVRLLKDSHYQVRALSAKALGQFKIKEEEAQKGLVQLLQDGNHNVRLEGIRALGEIGVKEKFILKGLALRLQDKHLKVRIEAAQTLGKLGSGEGVPQLIEILRGRMGTGDKKQALYAIYSIGPLAFEAVPEIILLLDNSTLRTYAASALGFIGPAASTALPTLARLLKNTQLKYWEKNSILQSMQKMGSVSSRVLPQIISQLSSKNSTVRSAAISALGGIGPQAARSVPQLIQALGHKDTQLSAVVALGNIGPAAHSAVPHLVQLLEKLLGQLQGYLYIKFMVAEALGKMGPKASPAVPALIRALEDKHLEPYTRKHTRIRAALALGKIGTPAASAVPPLIRMLKDKEFEIRRSAAEALGEMGPLAASAVPALIQSLQDTNKLVQQNVAMALGKIGPKAISALPLLIKMSNPQTAEGLAAAYSLVLLGKRKLGQTLLIKGIQYQKDFLIRRHSASFLKDLGKSASFALSHLIRALYDEDNFVRKYAVEALEILGSSEELVVLGLIHAMGDPYFDVRSKAMHILIQRGSKSSAFVPGLLKATKDKKWYKRVMALVVLNQTKTRNSASIAAIEERLKDENFRVKITAAISLSQMGEKSSAIAAILGQGVNSKIDSYKFSALSELEKMGALAKEAVPSLIRALGYRHSDSFRHQAVRTLHNIGKVENILPSLIQALKDSDPSIRSHGAEVIGKLGKKSAPAVPALILTLQDRHSYVRTCSAWALSEIGPAAAPAIPALAKALKDKQDVWVRRHAATALKNIGPPAASAVSALTEALADSDSQVRGTAGWALGNIGPPAASALYILKSNLQKKIEPIWGTVYALGGIGPQAASIVPLLIPLLKDKNVWVRRHAAWAMGRIGHQAASAIPQLLVMSQKDSDLYVRLDAAISLYLLDNRYLAAPILLKGLNNHRLNSYSIELLGKLGSSAYFALPYLNDLLSGNPTLQEEVKKAMEKILKGNGKSFHRKSSREEIQKHITSLSSEDYRTRLAAAKSLSEIGPAAHSAIQALIKALQDQDFSIRGEAALALGNMGPKGKAAISHLTQILQHKDKFLRQCAAIALGNIGPSAISALPQLAAMANHWGKVGLSAAYALFMINNHHLARPILLSALKDTSQRVHLGWRLDQPGASLSTLSLLDFLKSSFKGTDNNFISQIEGSRKKILAYWMKEPSLNSLHDTLHELVKDLRGDDFQARRFAARGIGELEEKGIPTVPLLIRVLEDNYFAVREEATQALKKIVPYAPHLTPLFQHLLTHKNSSVRKAAKDILSSMKKNKNTFILPGGKIWKPKQLSSPPLEPKVDTPPQPQPEKSGIRARVILRSAQMMGDSFVDLASGEKSVVIRTGKNLYSLTTKKYLLKEDEMISAFTMYASHPVYLSGQILHWLKNNQKIKLLEVPYKDVHLVSDNKYIYLTGSPEKGSPAMFAILPGQGFQHLFDLPRPVDSMTVAGSVVFYSIGSTIYSFSPGKKITVFAILPAFQKITSLAVDRDQGIVYASDDKAIYAMVLSKKSLVLLFRAVGGRLMYHEKKLYLLTTDREGVLYHLKGVAKTLLEGHPGIEKVK